MGFYSRHVLPRVVHYTCSRPPNMRQRRRVVPEAAGRVLEIGIGSGLNLPFYDSDRVEKLWGLDPSSAMWNLAEKQVRSMPIDVEFIEGVAEEIPLESATVDSAVVTYTLCTIPEVDRALSEIRRVLKPGGVLLFCEHGRAPDQRIRRWQDRLNPVWSRLGGGCNLNRDIPAILARAGFDAPSIRMRYIPGWKPASFNYWGSAFAK